MPATFALAFTNELSARPHRRWSPTWYRRRQASRLRCLYWAVNRCGLRSVIRRLRCRRRVRVVFLVDALTCLAGRGGLLALPETLPSAREKAARFSFADVAIPFRDRRFRAFFGASVLVALVFFQFNVAMPLDMKAHGISTNSYGLLVALNGLLVVLLSPFSAPLMLRMTRHEGFVGAA